MEQSNSLLLNEDALRQCPDPTKPIFIYEWLRFLERILPATQKVDIKNSQQKLLKQLIIRISVGLGPPSRILLAKCITNVFAVADTYDLFKIIDLCNDYLQVKEDSGLPLQIKLTALCVLGTMYEKLGRMVGRSYEVTYHILSKWIKVADSNSRIEILTTLSKMVHGLGSAAYSIHKDLYKLISKNYLTDRVMNVRAAAAKILVDLVCEDKSAIYLNDFQSICTLCLKALDSSDYYVRQEIANVFANLVVHSVKLSKTSLASFILNGKNTVLFNEKDILTFISLSFLRGGFGGFLKTGKTCNTVVVGGQKEIRIGCALAYVKIARALGMKWLEKNLRFWIQHLLEIVSKCGLLAYSNDVAQASEAVFIKRCILYVFRNTIGLLISEQYQLNACKHLGLFLCEYINCFDIFTEETKNKILSIEVFSSSEVLIVALLEISALVRQIGSTVCPLFVEASGIMEHVFACLLHPVLATRVAAAFCLRCVTLTVPSQCTPLIDRCMNRLEHMKKQAEAISGFSLALAAIVAGSRESELGIPFSKSQQVFTFAEKMIKTAAQSPTFAQKKIFAGWLLISAVISTGSSFVRHNLNRIIMLWKISFPRSLDEAKAEKNRGDTFTWECTLEFRAGALSSVETFFRYCSDLVTDELIKKIVLYVETCLITIAFIADIILSNGTALRNLNDVFRIRLYSLISKYLPINYFESLLSSLLCELVADITFSNNIQASTVSSLVSGLCIAVETSLLGGWLKDTTESYLELPIHAHQTVAYGALEYDSFQLVHSCFSLAKHETNFSWPEPLPANILIIDLAIQLFGKVFPILQTKLKLQLIYHFSNKLNNARQGIRLQAIQLNIIASVYLSMKSIADTPRCVKIEDEEFHRVINNLVLPYLNSDFVLLKCLAIETLGRIAQAVAEPQFVAGNAQYCFDKLRSIRDEKSRTGYALSLGCLHRYMGSLGTGQHLNTSVSIILALAQDNSSSTVQSWSIYSLSLIASTGGGMFRGYVEPSLSLCLRLLISTPLSHVDVFYSVAKLISTLITIVGPELLAGVGTIEHTRSSFLIACSMVYEHFNPQVKAEAIFCLQQLHLFAPRFVQLDRLVINNLLNNSHLILRKSAVCCLRQLLQREAKEVREHAQTISLCQTVYTSNLKDVSCLSIGGLESLLFELLDNEIEHEIRKYIKECILFLMNVSCTKFINFWFLICKNILASSINQENQNTFLMNEPTSAVSSFVNSHFPISPTTSTSFAELQETSYDANDTLQNDNVKDMCFREKILSRWPTRVFAFKILRKIMVACDNERAHMDLALAKELQMSSVDYADYLILHLSDLIRMGFMGATSENSSLRLAGLNCLQEVIVRFSSVPEPDFPGHVVLEQFQAQIGAALRPAFEPETSSLVTATACQVCSTWISSKVARDLNDLRRVYQLLVSSLSKLRDGSINTQLYNESAATLEKLSILKAWAEVYIVAVKKDFAQKLPQDSNKQQENLLSLVNPELNVLVGYWLAALRDSALILLPVEFKNQLHENSGAFFSIHSADTSKDYYQNCWPSILLATSIWLKNNNFNMTDVEKYDKWPDDIEKSYFFIMIGMCVEFLCNNRQFADFGDKTIQLCLSTLENLINCKWSQLLLFKDVRQPIEIINVIHRLLLICNNLQTQKMCIYVINQILNAAEFAIKNHEIDHYDGYCGGEGKNGCFDPKTSISFSVLEICLCLLVRQIPQINCALLQNNSIASLRFQNSSSFSFECFELVNNAVQMLIKIPCFCCLEGVIIVIPSMLYMILAVLKEASRLDSIFVNHQDAIFSKTKFAHYNATASVAIFALKSIFVNPVFNFTSTNFPEESQNLISFKSVLRSALLSLLKMVQENIKLDISIILLAITVLITSGFPNLVLGTTLFVRICRFYKDCLDSENVKLQISALQNVNSLFLHREIGHAFISELGPSVFNKIHPYVVHPSNYNDDTQNDKIIQDFNKSEIDFPTLNNLTDSELVLIQEAIKTIESILKHSSGKKERLFVNLLIKCLCRFLCSNPLQHLPNCSSNIHAIHDFSLQHLNAIGLNHPHSFKAILIACPDIRERIESAAHYLVCNRQTSNNNNETTTQVQDINYSRKPMHSSIKLNMDFSTFK